MPMPMIPIRSLAMTTHGPFGREGKRAAYSALFDSAEMLGNKCLQTVHISASIREPHRVEVGPKHLVRSALPPLDLSQSTI